jgi:hypothetical protein
VGDEEEARSNKINPRQTYHLLITGKGGGISTKFNKIIVSPNIGKKLVNQLSSEPLFACIQQMEVALLSVKKSLRLKHSLRTMATTQTP